MSNEQLFYKALVEYRAKPNIEAERRLYGALKSLTLFAPIKSAGSRKRVITALKDGNEEYIPVFTSAAEYAKLPIVQAELFALSFDDLKHMMLDDGRKIEGIVINPHGQAILFPLDMIQRVDSVTAGMSVQKTSGFSGGIRLDAPKSYPNGLIAAIERFMANRPEVSRVNLFKAKRNAVDRAHWLFWVYFPGSKADLFPEFAKMIQRYMKPGEVFELVQGTAGMKETASANKCVIYERP